MSYPRDLDDYTSDELIAELLRRNGLVQQGKCGYCSQPLDTHTCKFAGKGGYHDANAIARVFGPPGS